MTFMLGKETPNNDNLVKGQYLPGFYSNTRRSITENNARPDLDIFERQFLPERIEIGNNRFVNFVEIIPPHPEGNPLVLSLGWTGDIAGCRRLYEGFFRSNKHVFSIQYPTDRPGISKSELPEGFSPLGYRNALALTEAIAQKGYKNVDLVGHSLGAAVSLMANKLLTERGMDINVNNIVLVNPVGITPIDLKTGIHRWREERRQEDIRVRNNPGLSELAMERGVGQVLRHPLNTIFEGIDALRVDMQSLLGFAYRNNQNLTIIHAGDDPFTPQEELVRGIESMKSNERNNLLATADKATTGIVKMEVRSPHVLTIPASKKPGHLFNGLYPENPYSYAPLVCDVLKSKHTKNFPK
jgi:pimeloyl-ACP methyl ester carboxylesterase